MRPSFAVPFLAAIACLSTAAPARAAKPVITTSMKGADLEIVVHGVTDYCATNARTEVVRSGDTIRIVRARPSRVSRCFASEDVTVVVGGVSPGTYTVTYEQIPYVAPARPIRIAWATAFVHD